MLNTIPALRGLNEVVSATECEGVLCFLSWSLDCNQIYFTYPKILHLLLGCGEHQLDTVQLVYFAGARIIVDGHDIGLRIAVGGVSLITPLPTTWFGRQPKGWVQTMLCDTAVDQLQHLTGQEPAFTGLVSEGNNILGHTLPDPQCGPADRSDVLFELLLAAAPRSHSRALMPRLPNAGGGFLHAKCFCLEVAVVEAVEQEVSQIRNNGFGTFLLPEALPDGCWQPAGI